MSFVCLGGDDQEAWGLSVMRPLHCSGDQGPVHEGDSRLGEKRCLSPEIMDR